MAVNEELGIVESVNTEQEASKTDHRWATILDPRYRTAVILGIGLAIFQQVTGINTIIYYAPTIFQLAGFGSAAQSILATAGVGAVNVLMTVVSLRLLDRVGRHGRCC